MVCRVCKKELTDEKICSFCGEDNTPYMNTEDPKKEIDKSEDIKYKKKKFSKEIKETKPKRRYKLNKKKLLRLIIIITAIILVISVAASFFTKDEAPKPEPIRNTLFSSGMLAARVNGEWGYISSDDPSIFAVSPQFSHISNYHGNVAAVCIDGKFSIISKDGSLVCEPTFESVGSFSDNGFIAVKKDGKWGYINENADFVIEPKFTVAYGFATNKMAVVSVGGSYGFIGEDGEYTIAPQYDRAFSFTADNLAAVKAGGKWGYIDDKGTAVIEPMFEEAYPFENGFAVVKNYGSYGLIDKSGNMVIKPQFEDRFSFNGKYATVRVGNKYGVITNSGSYIINPSYIDLGSFSQEGLAYAKRGDGMTGFINEKDEFVIEPKYEDAKDFCLGLAPVKEGGLWGYVDANGDMVIDAKYLDASEFYSDGYAYVRNADNSVSVIDTQGNVAMVPSATSIENILK